MTLTSDGAAAYPNNQPVDKADVRALWAAADSAISTERTTRAEDDTGLRNAVRDGAILALTNVAGTGNAITADLSPAAISAGITALSTNTALDLKPATTNSAANPTLTVAGVTYGIRNADGGTWPAKAFVPGRSYLLRRQGSVLRVISGDMTGADLAAEVSARASADTDLRNQIAAFEAGMRIVGDWNPATGSFPTTPAPIGSGDQWNVTGSGTIDGVIFAPGDIITAITASPSSTTYAGNWSKRNGTATAADQITIQGTAATVQDFIQATNLSGRAQAMATDIQPDIQYLTVGDLRYVRDPAGTALTTADGAKWSPIGDSITPEAFGAVGDGVTNDSAAVQAALDFVTTSGRELLVTGTHRIDGDIAVSSGAKIRAVNGAFEGCTLRFAGSVGASTDLTAAIPAGVSVIPVDSTVSFAAGDYVRIVSCINSQGLSAGDYILGDRRTADPVSWLSENAKIARVDATNIYLDGRTVFPYSITPDADSGGRTISSVYKLDLVDNVQISGLTVRRAATSVRHAPIHAEYLGPNVRISGCVFDCSAATYVYARPIYLGMCYGARFAGCQFLGIKVEPLSASQGNSEVRSCQDVWFQGCNIVGGNQGLDMIAGGYPSVGGPCVGVRVENNTFSGTYTDAITTHWGCYGTIIRGNLIRCKSGNGIRIRSKGDVVEDNDIHGAPGGIGAGVFVSNLPMRGMIVRRNRITGFRDQILVTVLYEGSYTPATWPAGQCGLNISNNDLTAVTGGRECIRIEATAQASNKPINVSVHNNTLRLIGTQGSTGGVRLTAYANGCAITNNEIRGLAHGVYIMKNCINGVIEGNRIIDCAASIRGETSSGSQVEDTSTFGSLANAGFAIQRNYYINTPAQQSLPGGLVGLTPTSIT